MRGRTCDYVKPNGKFCGSLALRGRDYCYFHLTCVGRKLRAEKQFMITGEPPLELPPLEDINSIQIAIIAGGRCAAGSRLTTSREAASYTSRLTRPFACMTGCC